MALSTGILFAFGLSCRSETDSLNESVEIVDDALIEPVEDRAGRAEIGLAAELGVGLHWREKAGGQRSVDAFEELKEHKADRAAVGEEPIAARVRQLLDEALGAQ